MQFDTNVRYYVPKGDVEIDEVTGLTTYEGVPVAFIYPSTQYDKLIAEQENALATTQLFVEPVVASVLDEGEAQKIIADHVTNLRISTARKYREVFNFVSQATVEIVPTTGTQACYNINKQNPLTADVKWFASAVRDIANLGVLTV